MDPHARETKKNTIISKDFLIENVHSTKSNLVAYETKYHLKENNIHTHVKA